VLFVLQLIGIGSASEALLLAAVILFGIVVLVLTTLQSVQALLSDVSGAGGCMVEYQ
jgi:hypothetical protein